DARFDIVMCRNVLMYLTPAAIERAAGVLRDALAPDGSLIVGVSDPPLPLDGLARVRTESGIAHRPARHAGSQPAKKARAVRREERHHQRTSIPKPRTVAAPAHPIVRPQPRTAPKTVADRDRVACARHELRLGHASTAERLARELLAEGNDD